ncbi:membrane-associated phospholipid phosphatase [Sphaerochaeta pleomorpha str. Grapes]|uniref:Membrane-associated phospholipid phosphatase n=1 Tax=Sphaerochaeta pleomorpha (strain ATCC BAA-1885 / DSM 22778 / Grapes) TaxID=158190 RepID=G8QSL1_SPHPG|nr:phosphatase PAP2 family protein [Sphaerochaeta pleomorpha]AEV28972.1 membrane-associated phospholipid phosphatase [Sphaerochaeta pleomorpha str. Grapes]
MQETILLFFQNIANPFLDSFANICSALGEQTFVIAFIVAILWCFDKKKGFVICSSMLFSVTSMGILKAIVRAPRPFTVLPSIAGKRLATATGYSFPSGHTTTAASFYSALAVAYKKRTLSIISAIMIILVGTSRLYLGVHWPIDVFGGLVLGVSISLLASSKLSKLYEDKKKRYRFSLTLGSIVLVAGSILAILLQAGLVDEVAFSDLMKTLVLSGGGYLGFALEAKKVNYSTEGTAGRKIIRFLAGLAGVLAIMALKLIIPSSLYFLGSMLRYALIGFWATGLYPLIGKSLF